jgi:hypothetical protein
MSIIYPKAKDMMSKPRYWAVAYPLVITCLCVAPRDYFLKHWMSCFDAGLAKLKVGLRTSYVWQFVDILHRKNRLDYQL